MSTPQQPPEAQQQQAQSQPTSSSLPSTPAERTRRQAGLFFGGAVFVLSSAVVTRRALTRRYRPLSAAVPQHSTPASAHRPTNPASDTTLLSRGAPKSSEAQGYTTASTANATAQSPTPASPNQNPNPNQPDPETPDLNSSGPVLALEALTLATLNVVSWAVMLTGGALWALDIGNMEDLRRKVRGGLGVDGTGRDERQVEEELEEWIVGVLARKERKEMVREELGREWRNERGRER